jgi:mono/diheme cytochrome c family protein
VPLFRALHNRYPVEDLAETFPEGITTGHPSMPQFQLDPAQINDLLAYLDSVQG